jgi:hypothetical protein
MSAMNKFILLGIVLSIIQIGMATKTSWPELVGQIGTDAEATIKAERPDLNQVKVLNEKAPVTMDYREDRVRIFVDADNKVVSAPNVG